MRVHEVLLGAIAVVALLTGASARVSAQGVDVRAEEAAIRALVNRPDGRVSTRDAIFWSGAYPRPLVGQQDTARVKPFATARVEQRRNQKSTTDIVRLEVASAGDMAYEFSNFTLSYDVADTGQHRSFPGSLLRVWKKVNGQWEVAATFMRPHDVPFAPRD
jgi:ketosteroid isomerase-like protein